MRKIACSLLTAFFLTGFLFPLDEASHSLNMKLRVMASVANIRSGPSLNHSIIMQVNVGTELNAIGKEGKWYKVALSKKGIEPALNGYIHQSIVKVVSEPESVSKSPESDQQEKPKEDQPILVAQPESEKPVKATPFQQHKQNFNEKRMYIWVSYSLGFLEQTSSHSWQETIYYETADASIYYNIKKGNFFSAALGYRVYGAISLELGVDVTSRNMEETYSASIPHPLLFGVLRDDEGIEIYKLSENSVFLNIVYSVRGGRLGLDVSAGPAYIQSRSRTISGINYTDSYPYDSVTLSSEAIDISKNVFGFNGGAHVLFHFTENLAINLNARYVYGKADFDTGTSIVVPQITLGGLRLGGGLRVLF